MQLIGPSQTSSWAALEELYADDDDDEEDDLSPPRDSVVEGRRALMWQPPKERLCVLVLCADYSGLQQEDMEQEVRVVQEFCARLNQARPGYVQLTVWLEATRESVLDNSLTFDIVHIVAHGEKSSKNMILAREVRPDEELLRQAADDHLSVREQHLVMERLSEFGDAQVMEWWVAFLTSAASPCGAVLLLQGCDTLGLAEQVKDKYRAVSATLRKLAHGPAMAFALTFYDLLGFKLKTPGLEINLSAQYSDATKVAGPLPPGYPGVLLEGFEPNAFEIAKRQNWLRFCYFVVVSATDVMRGRLGFLLGARGVDAENMFEVQQWIGTHSSRPSRWNRRTSHSYPDNYQEWGLLDLFWAFNELRDDVDVSESENWDRVAFAIAKSSLMQGWDTGIDEENYADALSEITKALEAFAGVEDLGTPVVVDESIMLSYAPKMKELMSVVIPWYSRLEVLNMLIFVGMMTLRIAVAVGMILCFVNMYNASVVIDTSTRVLNLCSAGGSNVASLCSAKIPESCHFNVAVKYFTVARWSGLTAFADLSTVMILFLVVTLTLVMFHFGPALKRRQVAVRELAQRQVIRVREELIKQAFHEKRREFWQIYVQLGIILIGISLAGALGLYHIGQVKVENVSVVKGVLSLSGNTLLNLTSCVHGNSESSWAVFWQAPDMKMLNLSLHDSNDEKLIEHLFESCYSRFYWFIVALLCITFIAIPVTVSFHVRSHVIWQPFFRQELEPTQMQVAHSNAEDVQLLRRSYPL